MAFIVIITIPQDSMDRLVDNWPNISPDMLRRNEEMERLKSEIRRDFVIVDRIDKGLEKEDNPEDLTSHFWAYKSEFFVSTDIIRCAGPSVG